ncbi:thioredoxin [Halioxenophilus sp. WMMB6]|uniref:thioredoxin n=1 Tax=Halioxenophilus sp. WMMB6 TaxID=3073815 RepID=UPI00295EC560|nr:thioredoxin [Halioxenophilus sp. WMMB6]
MNDYVVDIDQGNAQQMLIDESMKRLVVVDFWAEWCSHCKTLTPVLERLAGEYGGQFLLAKVNAEEQQMIAGQLGVRSLPTVILIKDGQPVDGFTGAQPESAVREVLDKYLPKPWDLDLQSARELMSGGDYSSALPLLRQAHTSAGGQIDITLTLADCLLQSNRMDEAEELLAEVRMADQDEYYKTLMARLELQKQSAKSPEIEALESELERNPDDKAIQLQLAVQYSQNGMHAEALELLLKLLRGDMNYQDGAAKKLFLDMLATLGKADPLAIKYQRRYYTLLY